MENTIIELKESEAQETGDQINGSFNINLKKKLDLFDGDELIIKNCFVDTVASSGGLIVLEENTTVTIDFCRSFTFNTGITNDSTGTALNSLLEPDNGYRVNLNLTPDQRHTQCQQERNSTKKGDGFKYYQLEEKTISGGNDFLQANNIEFFSDISSKGYSGHYGGVSIAFAFLGIDGKVKNISIQLQNSDATESGKSTVQSLGFDTFIFNKTWKGDGRGFLNGAVEVISSTSTLEEHNLSPNFLFTIGESPIPAGDFYNLKQESISFVIPKGAYDPNNLARVITDACVVRDNKQFNQVFDKTDPQVFPFSTKMYGPSNNKNVGNINHFYLSSDSEVLLNLQSGANMPICGCNEFSLIFDGENGTQTFKFVSLHTPYYVNIASGGESNLQIGNEYSIRGNTSNNNVVPFSDTTRGDIIILGLDARDENNNYIDFWFGKLGLNPNLIVAGHQNYNTFRYSTPGGDVSVKIPILQIINGINCTDSFLGADSIMPNNILVPTTASYISDIKTSNLMTTPIFGLKTLGVITDTNGYFLISISGYNNNVRMIGESDINANISAIVSRFYASTSFTNGYINDSVSYIHRGEPILLSDFSIRILDPGHKISSDIGNDSTIFLLVNRAQREK